MLERLKEGLQSTIRKLLGATVVDEALVKELIRDLQRTLLQADVNVRLVLELSSRIERRALSEMPPPGLARKDHIIRILYEELSSLLGGEEARLELPTNRANLILLVGIQGSGKTTIAAKLARYYKKKGYKVGVVCADTFRPGAYEQLKTLCSLAGVELLGPDGIRDPISIAKRRSEEFKAQGKNIIIIDTAGRHKEERGLLEEMKQLNLALAPHLVLLVVDATIGQQCYSQAEAFHKAAPVGGVVVTKLDGAAKGGGALAAAAATRAKVLFLGTGERIDDLEPFSPTRFIGRLLGMGDIRALLERARALEQEADERKVQRILSGKMSIEDLYYQLEQVRKLGSLKKILELIPGLSGLVREEESEAIERMLDRWKAIIQSMTKEERENPELLNASRIRRIARGSGSREADVKEMLAHYRKTKQLLKAGGKRAIRQMLQRLPQA